ncbi:bet1-like SNARE 1-1 [Pyrus ussuriensis x Pyrus communis]|uniref:Bet1-like SNARE 1-1 n=1 Tax=Pyrus ussuriensis x Pyrus communis TaxID=2448454 RepID=A0A5N5GYF1_9ROSA|nr:bet1-like SNARE 1-1 [Pyrus ussuriensis x Pyrus communis]
MNARRDFRGNKVALFDGIEEGGIRSSASYSHEIDEHDNERAVDGLQDRVNLLKRLSGDIHEEVETHNHMLDRMVCTEMIWIHRGECYLVQWTSLRWSSRPSQARECLR